MARVPETMTFQTWDRVCRMLGLEASEDMARLVFALGPTVTVRDHVVNQLNEQYRLALQVLSLVAPDEFFAMCRTNVYPMREASVHVMRHVAALTRRELPRVDDNNSAINSSAAAPAPAPTTATASSATSARSATIARSATSARGAAESSHAGSSRYRRKRADERQRSRRGRSPGQKDRSPSPRRRSQSPEDRSRTGRRTDRHEQEEQDDDDDDDDDDDVVNEVDEDEDAAAQRRQLRRDKAGLEAAMERAGMARSVPPFSIRIGDTFSGIIRTTTEETLRGLCKRMGVKGEILNATHRLMPVDVTAKLGSIGITESDAIVVYTDDDERNACVIENVESDEEPEEVD